jgi:hypothetical protein
MRVARRYRMRLSRLDRYDFDDEGFVFVTRQSVKRKTRRFVCTYQTLIVTCLSIGIT